MSRRSSLFLVLTVTACVAVAQLALAQGSSSTSSDAAKSTTSSAEKAMSSKPAKMHTAKSMAPRLDLNSASREDLIKLPGIGEVLADKIIAARPFKMKSELMSKGILTKGQYRKVAAHIIAKKSS